MKIDITWAGLTEEQQRRLGIATQLLAAHGLRATVRDWDGTRCDALVVDTADSYGISALSSALRRHIRVLGFGCDGAVAEDGTRLISRGSPTALIARKLIELTAREALVDDTPASPLLVRLADDATWAETTVSLARQGVRLTLSRRDSRVWIDCAEPELDVADGVDLDEWSLSGPAVDEATHPRGQLLRGTLDSFLLTAAQRSRHPLPPFPDGRWALREWPDLGAATQAVECLRVVRALLGSACSARQLADEHGFAPQVVDSSLWAFKAAGLLERDGDDAPAAAAGGHGAAAAMASGLFKRLARRFGLAA